MSISTRQAAFLQLKPPCVHLSSVALKFRTKDAPAKDVLKALEGLKSVLSDLGIKHQLDPKLAEYAFFPLAQQVFNEAKRLSSRCLEVATECVTLLVKYGYRSSLQPELGKQLLILMSMLAGGGPKGQTEEATDELRLAALECMSQVIEVLAGVKHASKIFDDQATQSVADQLVYLLLESITDSASDKVQVLASELLLQLLKAIMQRVFLASLLPRTASSLTKSLRPSTKAKRTQKVLSSNLAVLQYIVEQTLADDIALDPVQADEKEALDKSWLQATTSQVKNVLLQVCKLRTHESFVVRQALEELCTTVIESCQKTLVDAIPGVLETLVVLAAYPDASSAKNTCRHILLVYPEMADMLRTSFSNWTRSLPRQLQLQDERPKQIALKRLTATFPLMMEAHGDMEGVTDELVPVLIDSVDTLLQSERPSTFELDNAYENPITTLIQTRNTKQVQFSQFLMNQESQKATRETLDQFMDAIKQSSQKNRAGRLLVDVVAESYGFRRVAALWLALRVLGTDSGITTDINDFLAIESTEDKYMSRTALLTDLNAVALTYLSSVFVPQGDSDHEWQIQALAMEAIILHAQTFEGEDYRPELVDTLYPVLSFVASSNQILKSHAITALDKLARTCQYPSVKDLLISNADYLVNSIAWKLNTYSLSPEAPQILRMMTHLCGAELVPYLDDLIQSVFAALDSYHGYPEWVELLFDALKSIVHVSVHQPQLAITMSKDKPVKVSYRKSSVLPSTESDILNDLKARKRRKLDFDRAASEPPTSAPHRPWTSVLDGPSFPKPEAEATEEDDNEQDPSLDENGEPTRLAPMKPTKGTDDPPKPSKSHSLLLSIATATTPHLASPSPRVRSLLLDLLRDISPLLSKDENTYFPLINTIWPVVVPRLFADIDTGEDPDGNQETAYNVASAADTIAVLCECAGDFMASRIEDIFQQLMRMFKKIRAQVDMSSEISRPEKPQVTVGHGAKISGSVNLQLIKHEAATNTPLTKTSGTSTSQREFSRVMNGTRTRTSKGMILSSLVELMVSIISHVHLTLDTGDTVMDLLLPMMHRREGIRDVLETYNADSVWLYALKDQPQGQNGKSLSGDRPPLLRQDLVDLGMDLKLSEIIT